MKPKLPPKKKHGFIAAGTRKSQTRLYRNIADDEETPFDNDVSFEGSDVDGETPAPISKFELEEQEGDEKYKPIPRN